MRKRPYIIVIIATVLLLASIIITSGQRDRLSIIEGAVGEITTPVQGFMYKMATTVSNFFNSFSERKELKNTNEELAQRVNELEKELLEMSEVVKENQRLKGLLDFSRDNENMVVTGARVTGKEPGGWFNVFTINKGTKQGVANNMAVVTDKGLTGRIIDVGPDWSKVRSLVDGQSSVSGIVERTRDIGMVRGNNSLSFEDGKARMIHLPLDSDIVVGDRILTSGLGEIFPKGLYIGEVTEISSESRDLFITAVIQPGVDFERLEEVLVIKSTNSE